MTDPGAGPTRVAIALGTNLGDRQRNLEEAVAALRGLLADLAVSSFHDTAPVGVPLPHPNYLNAAVTGLTSLTPRTLLARLHDIERALGRVRPHANAPRTIDLDLILHGDARVDEPSLRVPHPRFRDRAFVLGPLAEIAPAMVDPESGLSIGELFRRLPPTIA